ncbi:hypothetical protein GQ43DRAFT_367677 [Delitschia confertaspora ATCC 74209]|uniref:BTB domain-containing protein n=1 Tax=Delitschia confertaspora ATCC 74209 TaxID=1513339 RepID=A0A9P4JTP8_9PLEO|nr:hypothetical protein GQ43DRAFT_367677 [Delitschia confertaspora ATCC 74209]
MSPEKEYTIIAPTGDLILDVRQTEGADQFFYRVDSETLRQNSRYFEKLLSDQFSEGSRVRAVHQGLRNSGTTIAEASPDILPQVSIIDVGKISKVSTIQLLTADFLRALHGHDLSVTKLPIANLANLAVVADRFDALPSLTTYVRRKKYIQALDARTRANPNAASVEERARQKLMIGLFLDYAPWVTKYSLQLILRDSAQWGVFYKEPENIKALWWDIPNGIEADELVHRREYILDTINSLQSHFLKLYTSGDRQCRLGYDSSPQCDSFQLGEMTRFFVKINTLRLQGTIYDVDEDSRQYCGDIDRLIESLRQCPSYQIDRNHAHCGLRVRLIPLLDFIQNWIGTDSGGGSDIGLCLDCWKNHRGAYAWTTAKRPVLWTRSTATTGRRSNGFSRDSEPQRGCSSRCLDRHIAVRDIFMAADREWTDRGT